ncbi:hypothetical protein Phum_PHUM439070, partial [Pediculus humanus corporis]
IPLPLNNLNSFNYDVELNSESDNCLDELSENINDDCHDNECVLFPNFPKEKTFTQYENDENLLDIIYENFPSNFKFYSQDDFCDFSDALKHAHILTQNKNLKMYEKKKNGFFQQGNKLTLIFNQRIPYIKFENIDTSEENSSFHLKPKKNGFTSLIDEPHTKKNHLITTKSFECIFLQESKNNGIFLGDLFKPFLQNSWFGRLPQV